MSGTAQRRVNGVQFGTLAEKLRERDYPASREALVEDHGDHKIELPGGTETLRAALSPLSTETFESADAVRRAVVGTVGGAAVGRRRYTDRDPPTDGAGGVGAAQSF